MISFKGQAAFKQTSQVNFPPIILIPISDFYDSLDYF